MQQILLGHTNLLPTQAYIMPTMRLSGSACLAVWYLQQVSKTQPGNRCCCSCTALRAHGFSLLPHGIFRRLQTLTSNSKKPTSETCQRGCARQKLVNTMRLQQLNEPRFVNACHGLRIFRIAPLNHVNNCCVDAWGAAVGGGSLQNRTKLPHPVTV